MPKEISLLVAHVATAFLLSGLLSGVLSSVFKRASAVKGRELTGNEKFIITIIVSVVISFGYTMYYAQLPLVESVAVFIILVLGPSAFYEVFIDKGQNQNVTVIDNETGKIEEK